MDIAGAQHALSLDSVAAPNQKHWTIASPLATHWRAATCEEVGCLDHNNGWRIRIDTLPAEMQHAAKTSGRHWSECVIDVDPDTGERYDPPAVYFVFEAGQPCFRASTHQVPVGRPELYLVGNRGEVRTYDRSDQWADDCATETDKIVNIIGRG